MAANDSIPNRSACGHIHSAAVALSSLANALVLPLLYIDCISMMTGYVQNEDL